MVGMMLAGIVMLEGAFILMMAYENVQLHRKVALLEADARELAVLTARLKSSSDKLKEVVESTPPLSPQ